MIRSLVAIAVLPGLSVEATGHDIPDARVDRAIQVRLEPPALIVEYEINLSEWTLYQDLKALETDLPPRLDRDELLDWYGRRVMPLNARGLLAHLDGRPLSWGSTGFEVFVIEHPVYTFRYRAEIPRSGRLVLKDSNYVSSRGTSRLALSTASGVIVRGFEGPDDVDDVPERPVWMLSDEEEDRTRQLEITYETAGAETPVAIAEPAQARSNPAPSPAITSTRSRSTRGDERSGASLSALLLRPTGNTWPMLCLVAAMLGAAHAIQPGHGKTAVVATSIDGPNRVQRGVLLASTIAVMHLTVAVGLAAIVTLLVPDRFEGIDTAMARGTGLILGVVGFWRLGRHLGGHTEHAEENAAGRVETNRGAIVVGLAIGLIPCWDAILLLILARAIGQATLGLGLVVAFSLGASATLLGVGLSASLVRRLASRMVASKSVEHGLGAVGGLLLAVAGTYLIFR